MLVKKVVLVCLFFFSLSHSLKADEGMWLPYYLKVYNEAEMLRLGSKLTSEQIYSSEKPSIKDAIVNLGGGNCSGEIVSPEGLVFTNHHCAYDLITNHSTSENNYLKDGFWAKEKIMELPNQGMTASILKEMRNVTPIFERRLKGVTNEEIRQIRIDILSDSLVREVTKNGQYEAEVKPFFKGSEYYLLIQEVFRDVRLVAAPPQFIGKFGGEVDNWMWPRHTGDFAILRIYTAPDGSSANYSVNNVPMRSSNYLKISTNGYKEDDFAFIMGYPGSTRRYLTSNDVDFIQRYINPAAIEALELQQKIVSKLADQNESKRLKLASSLANTGNAYKYYLGQQRQLNNKSLLNKFWDREDKFKIWYNSNDSLRSKFGKLIIDIDNANLKLKIFQPVQTYFELGIFSTRFAQDYWYNTIPVVTNITADKKSRQNPLYDSTVKSLKKLINRYLNDSTLEADFIVLKEETKLLYARMPDEMRLEFIDRVFDKEPIPGMDLTDLLERFMNEAAKKSMFMNPSKMRSFIQSPKPNTLVKDPIYKLLANMYGFYKSIESLSETAITNLENSHRVYIGALKKFHEGDPLYPDANSTLRVTYGSIKSYYPRNGLYYKYYSTSDGILQKQDTIGNEYKLPEDFTKLLREKKFGTYAQNDTLRVNFLANTDITGGNSGSPVMNKSGNLIGIAFDGNWESMVGDMYIDPKLSRTICVDIRYVLWVIDVYANAQNIMSELRLLHKPEDGS